MKNGLFVAQSRTTRARPRFASAQLSEVLGGLRIWQCVTESAAKNKSRVQGNATSVSLTLGTTWL